MFSYYSLIVSFLNKFLQVNSMKSVMYLFEDLVREICGPASIKILKLLEGKENVSEFVLAENLDMNINELRTYLYKLSENNLIYSTRKKDKQKGWYVYYWTFNFRHARDLLIKNKEKQLEDLRNKLNHKEIPKYVCPNNCTSLFLEDAMELEFKCPECNSLLKLKEVKYDENVLGGKIKEIEAQLDELRKAVIVEVVSKEKKVVKRAERKAAVKSRKKSKRKVAKKKQKKVKREKKAKRIIRKKAKKEQNKKVNRNKPSKKKKGILSKLKKRIRF